MVMTNIPGMTVRESAAGRSITMTLLLEVEIPISLESL